MRRRRTTSNILKILKIQKIRKISKIQKILSLLKILSFLKIPKIYYKKYGQLKMISFSRNVSKRCTGGAWMLQ